MTKNSLLCPFYLLIYLFASTLLAKTPNENEKALCALSSLGFYLEEQLSETPKEHDKNQIFFSEADISQLWEKAAKSPLTTQIQKAQFHFEHSFDPC